MSTFPHATVHPSALPAPATGAAVHPRPGDVGNEADDRDQAAQVARLRAGLAGRYQIERELGRGGMATVYLAREVGLDRLVAVKVLRPELAATVGGVRFAREVRLAARLQHPHIVPVLAAGDDVEAPYYVMPFVPGESLRDRLRREGCLTLGAALAITREIGAALDYAHRQGVVHRDVKPENVLLGADDHAMVADFGIARVLTGADGGTLTATGLAVGTPSYMSPEQGAGDRVVDGRSDVYSLACVLYEMLAAEPPFAGVVALAVIAQHHTAPIPWLRLVRADAPAAVDLAIRRALAKNPEDRWASAAEFVAALEAACASLPAPGGADGGDAVAVLDFTDRSSDASLDWLGGALAETVTSALRRRGAVRALPGEQVARVVARRGGTVGSDAEAIAVSRLLGAQAVVWGVIERSPDGLLVTPRVGRADAGALTPLEPAGGAAADALRIQDRVVARVVQETDAWCARPVPQPLAHGGLAPSAGTTTHHVSAYEAFARGRQLFRRFGPASFEAARAEFERAIAADPNYALAYAGLGSLFAFRFIASGDAADLAAAVGHLERALALDSELGEAYVWLGYAYMRQHRLVDGERCLDRALELEPDNPHAHYFRAGTEVVLPIRGRPWAERASRAVGYYLRAIELEPSSQAAYMTMAVLYVDNGQYAPARRLLDRAVLIEETVKSREMRFVGALALRALLHVREAEDAAAGPLLARALERYPATDHVYAPAFVALAECVCGEIAARRRDPDEAVALYTAAAERCAAHPRTIGMGLVLARARAGIAKAFRALGMRREEQAQVAAAAALLDGSSPYDCEWMWGASRGQVRYDLASCHAAAGRADDARRELDAAIAADWGDHPMLARDESFARLRQGGALDSYVARLLARGAVPEPPEAFWSGTTDL